jgi:hypothetical protein
MGCADYVGDGMVQQSLDRSETDLLGTPCRRPLQGRKTVTRRSLFNESSDIIVGGIQATRLNPILRKSATCVQNVAFTVRVEGVSSRR